MAKSAHSVSTDWLRSLIAHLGDSVMPPCVMELIVESGLSGTLKKGRRRPSLRNPLTSEQGNFSKKPTPRLGYKESITKTAGTIASVPAVYLQVAQVTSAIPARRAVGSRRSIAEGAAPKARIPDHRSASPPTSERQCW